MSSLQNPMQAFDGLPIRQAVSSQIFPPAVASQMITLIYNLADTYLWACSTSPAQTAAITVVYSPFLMLTAISNLFGVGGARPGPGFGPQGPGQGPGDCRHLLLVGGGGHLVFCALFWVFAAPILSLCGATADTLPIALGYAKWAVVIGGPATILNTLLANLIRAEGKAGQPPSACPWAASPTWCWTRCSSCPSSWAWGRWARASPPALSNGAAVVYFRLSGPPRNETSSEPAPPATSATPASTCAPF